MSILVNESYMRILRLFIVVLGVMLLVWVAIDHVPLVLQLFGHSAKGRVTGKDVVFHGSDQEVESGVLTLRYEFEAGGAKHSGDASVPRAVYDAAEPGKSVTVRYLPANPAVNFPDGYLGQGVRGLPLLIAGCVCLMIGFFFIKPQTFII